MRVEAPPRGRSLPAPILDGDSKQLRADIVAAVSALVGAARARLLVLETATGVLRDDVVQLELEEFPLARAALASGTPAWHDDPAGDALLADALGFEPRVCVPLHAGAAPLGVVALEGASRPPEHAEAFARVAARALATARGPEPTVATTLAAASRVARDLHDDVAQLLFSIGITAKAAAAAEPVAVQRSRLESIVALSTQSTRRLRAAIATLRAADEAASGLGPALEELVTATRARTGLPVQLDLDAHSRAATGHVADVLYRICREGLANVARHADATWCRVRCSIRAGEAIAEVEDDGVGLDAAEDEDGFGLAFLREAVEALGGSLELRARQPAGTVLVATIPPTG